jgi:phosphoribosylglycinamide formyltransferase 1
MVHCAVFASGGGSNFQSLIDRKKSGELTVDLSLLIVNNSGAGAVKRAEDNGIPVVHCAPSHFESETQYARELEANLDKYRIEYILLAGYMKKLPSVIVTRFRNRILNIHPGLLPAFGGKGMYGKRVHQAVLDFGAKISGITIHFVDEEYDHGPVIFQDVIPVKDDDNADSLASRVLQLEHASYWRVADAVCNGRMKVEGRRVIGTV